MAKTPSKRERSAPQSKRNLDKRIRMEMRLPEIKKQLEGLRNLVVPPSSKERKRGK